MAKNIGVWGVDIGQCALKALRLELIDGRPTATDFDYIEHAKILSQPDADPDTLIREALEKFLSRNAEKVKYDEVAISISGQSGLVRFVKLPPVEEKKIGDIVKFEARQQIPFPLDEVIWDYQKIAGGEAVEGFATDTEIGLFAMKRDVISRYLGYFQSTRMEVHLIQMTPLALVNFAIYEIFKKGGPAEDTSGGEETSPEDTPRGKKRCVVVLDIGTEASNLIITDGDKVIWQRPIPLGGNNFTRALTKELKLTFAKAEHLKRNAAKSPEMANILKAIKPVLSDFVGEVQRSLGYFSNTHRDCHISYMVGLGSAFKLPGLQKYLSEKLSLDVRKPTEFHRLAGEQVTKDPLFTDNVLTFPVAYGLALQGLGLARLTTNLLPTEIRTDRLIRAKKPYAAAAAAMLLLGVFGLAFSYAAPYKALSDPAIDKSIKEVEAASKDYSRQESEYNSRITKAKETQSDVKLIIAGQEERLNWPRFLEVQTAALPRPPHGQDPGNLQDPEQQKFWKMEGDIGLRAYQWWLSRMRDGVRIDQMLDDANSENPKYLAVVNVEAFHTRWVKDLGKFLDQVDTLVFKEYRENIADTMKEDERVRDETQNRNKPKPLEGGGWVVEIRGYTEHEAGPQFIKLGLVRNLQQIDKFAQDETKISRYIVGGKDPVKGKVSHVFVYKVWTVNNATSHLPVHIQQSYLEAILGGGRRGGMDGTSGPPGMAMGTPPGGAPGDTMGAYGSMMAGAGGAASPADELAPQWRPLKGGRAAMTPGMPGYSGSGGMIPPGTGSPDDAGAPGAAGSGGISLPPPPTGTAGGIGLPSPPVGTGGGVAPGGPILPGGSRVGQPPSTSSGSGRIRHEFVVMFIWREPVPPVPVDTP
ncbi:MAG: type IV pilus assembly protein PilM [Gemmataceae bacterium]|nr:type IV pilus assembly protein PilM [Gemmataceae bacterium]